MTIALQLTPEEEAKLAAKARAQGVSLESFVQNLVKQAAEGTPAVTESDGGKPSGSLLGLLAKYGRAPSAEEIDRNRSEMFGSFREADPE